RFPVATSDGRTVVFESSRTGDQAGIWKMDVDGHDAVQLVAGTKALAPHGVANDRHVVFLSNRDTLQAPSLVPIEGGTQTQVLNLSAVINTFDLSPDEQSIVFGSRDDQQRRMTIVCDLPACSDRQSIAVPANRGPGRLRWTRDGRGFAYLDVPLANIWIQPLD